MTDLWTPDHVHKLLLAPQSIVAHEPWRSWIQARGGLDHLYARLRQVPLKPIHADVLAALLTYPGESVLFYQTQLGIERSGYHSRKKHLLNSLSRFLTSWELPAPTAGGRSRRLPVPLTPLIGRSDEIAVVMRLTQREDVRLLSLVGPGGTGKTRLALQVAANLTDAFTDGAIFVPLSGLVDAARVPMVLAHYLGVKESTAPLIETIKAALRPRHMLVVFDNFEHVTDAGPMIAELLEAAPDITALITSRRALQLYGEHRYLVPPLPCPPPATSHPLATILAFDAVRLFVDRARAVDHTWQITDIHAPVLATLCARLDGLPLALELAAARAATCSLDDLLAGLDAGLQSLSHGPINVSPHHQTLQATLDWSYALLNPIEQQLFVCLGVFVGGSTISSITAVCRGFLDPELIPRTLDSLAQHNLLAIERTDDARITVLETIHVYAAERLRTEVWGPALRGQHARYYLEWIERIEPDLKGPAQVHWLEQLSIAYLNIQASLEWHITRQEREAAERLCGALGRFWWIRGFLSEGRGLIARIWDLPGAVQPAIAAKTLSAFGLLAYAQSQYADAAMAYEQCLTIRRDLDDSPGIAAMLSNLGILAWVQGYFDRAVLYFEESLAREQAHGDPRSIAASLNNLGGIATEQGRLADAARYYEACLVLKREAQDTWGTANALLNYGVVLYYQGDELHNIEALYVEGQALMEQLQDSWGIARAMFQRSLLACEQGQFATAHSHLKESLRMQTTLGDTRGILNSLAGCAQMLCMMGYRDDGHALFDAISRLRGAYGIPAAPQEQIRQRQIRERYQPLYAGDAQELRLLQSSSMTIDTLAGFALERTTTAVNTQNEA